MLLGPISLGILRRDVMGRIRQVFLFIAFTGCVPLLAQAAAPAAPPPQSARQALIEMFMGKGENDFARHLPEAARQTLIHKGETPDTSIILKISTIARQAAAQGEHLETFDEGSTFLTFEQSASHEKTEVAVEHDSLLGEDDEIELSIHYYKEGQLQSLPVVPRLIFTLRQEKEIWRLMEVTVAAHIPLTDPDYLKGLRREQDEANELQAQMRVSEIAAAEAAYAAKHPDLGYACALSSFSAPDPATESGEASNSLGLANAESGGYRFAISGCEGTPASKYRVTAVPADSDETLKMFCADESGTLKFVIGGKGSTCFTHGQPVNVGAAAEVTVD
jgi:hypothetical protein